MPAIALVLFVWRGLVRPERRRSGWLRLSFWELNIGLALAMPGMKSGIAFHFV